MSLKQRLAKRLYWIGVKLKTWLNRGKAFWLFVVGVVGAIAISLLLAWWGCFEITKTLSTSLELIGVSFVFRQINSKRTTFGRPKFFNGIFGWLQEFPSVFSKPKNIELIGGSAFGSVTLFGRFRSTHGPASNSIFDRIDALEKNMKISSDEIDRLQSDLDKSVAGLKDNLNNEVSKRTDEDTRIFESLKTLSIADSELEYLGLIFVAIGVIANNLPAITKLVFNSCSL
jgi:hypothetical protein